MLPHRAASAVRLVFDLSDRSIKAGNSKCFLRPALPSPTGMRSLSPGLYPVPSTIWGSRAQDLFPCAGIDCRIRRNGIGYPYVTADNAAPAYDRITAQYSRV